MGFLLALAVFPGHFMKGQQTESNSFLTERFSFAHCEKHSDVFRTRQKKQRQLQQLVQNTISTIKCSGVVISQVLPTRKSGCFQTWSGRYLSQRRINGALTTAEQAIREEILVGLLTGQRWAVTGFLMQSGIGFKGHERGG